MERYREDSSLLATGISFMVLLLSPKQCPQRMTLDGSLLSLVLNYPPSLVCWLIGFITVAKLGRFWWLLGLELCSLTNFVARDLGVLSSGVSTPLEAASLVRKIQHT